MPLSSGACARRPEPSRGTRVHLAAVGAPPEHLPWSGATRWAGPEQWQELCTRCDLPDVDVLLTGYLERWIPDGRITLGP
jgi:hypothetical protein